MSKLKNKLLKETPKVKFWNGYSIKRVTIGGWDFKFQAGGIKYNLELEVESKCDRQTNFTPALGDIILMNCKEGRRYTGAEQIAEILNLSTFDIMDIFMPMVKLARYTEEEIEECKKEYDDFLVSFRENFYPNYND